MRETIKDQVKTIVESNVDYVYDDVDGDDGYAPTFIL